MGKRYYSERLNSTNNTAIIEHHRSVQWSEKEYISLFNLVQQNQSVIQKEMVDEFDATLPLFADYCKILVSNKHMLDMIKLGKI